MAKERPAAQASKAPYAPSESQGGQIGIRLKHARLVNPRLRELADMLDCFEVSCPKLRPTKVRPSLAMLRRIVGALKINIASLFDERSAKAPSRFNFLVRQIDLTTCPNVPTLAQPGPIDAFLAGGGADRVAEEFHCSTTAADTWVATP